MNTEEPWAWLREIKNSLDIPFKESETLLIQGKKYERLIQCIHLMHSALEECEKGNCAIARRALDKCSRGEFE